MATGDNSHRVRMAESLGTLNTSRGLALSHDLLAAFGSDGPDHQEWGPSCYCSDLQQVDVTDRRTQLRDHEICYEG